MARGNRQTGGGRWARKRAGLKPKKAPRLDRRGWLVFEPVCGVGAVRLSPAEVARREKAYAAAKAVAA